MRGGRVWLILGAIAGVAIAAGHLPYLAGAGRSLVNTAERLVQSGANRLIKDAAQHGAPKRVVQGIGAALAVLLPGVTALLMIVAAKASLRIRSLIALAMVALGAASYFYQPHGNATGVLLLALVLGGLAVVLTGPLVAAPLALGAGLIGAEFLPTLFTKRLASTRSSVNTMHSALFGHPGTPVALQIGMLVIAVIPFAIAVRMVLSR